MGHHAVRIIQLHPKKSKIKAKIPSHSSSEGGEDRPVAKEPKQANRTIQLITKHCITHTKRYLISPHHPRFHQPITKESKVTNTKDTYSIIITPTISPIDYSFFFFAFRERGQRKEEAETGLRAIQLITKRCKTNTKRYPIGHHHPRFHLTTYLFFISGHSIPLRTSVSIAYTIIFTYLSTPA